MRIMCDIVVSIEELLNKPAPMNVETYIPPTDHPLHPYLQAIWRCNAKGDYSRETILPKGNVDIFFNFADTIGFVGDRMPSDGMLRQAPYLAGPQVGPIESRPRNEVYLLGMSLKMEGCSALLRLPVHEITDHLLDAAEFFRDANELIDRVYSAATFADQCAILLTWMMRRLRPEPRTEMLRVACRSLGELPTETNLDRVAHELNLSSRHLRRLFLRHLGIGPSHYIRLSRFVRSLHMIPTETSLTEIAHAVHYFDQAHFCRDFKEIAGMTPSEYRARAGHVPGHLFSA